jgi:hypothetical protein
MKYFIVTLFLAFILSAASYSQVTVMVRCGDNFSEKTYPSYETCGCTEWAVDLYNPRNSMKKWGSISNSSRDKVERELKQARDQAHKYKGLFEFDWDHTSDIYCRAGIKCGPLTKSSYDAVLSTNVMKSIKDLQDKLKTLRELYESLPYIERSKPGLAGYAQFIKRASKEALDTYQKVLDYQKEPMKEVEDALRSSDRQLNTDHITAGSMITSIQSSKIISQQEKKESQESTWQQQAEFQKKQQEQIKQAAENYKTQLQVKNKVISDFQDGVYEIANKIMANQMKDAIESAMDREEKKYESYQKKIESATEETPMLPCNKCFGGGSTICNKCAGGYYQVCSHCAGKGQETCANCSGSGIVSYGLSSSSCISCSGTGKTKCFYCTAGYENCSGCNGKGSKNCYSCSGKGSVKNQFYKPAGKAEVKAIIQTEPFESDIRPLATFDFGKQISIKEFNGIFEKNRKDNNIDPKEFFQQYINFNIKVLEAESLGFHKRQGFIKEFEGYRKQIIDAYNKGRAHTGSNINAEDDPATLALLEEYRGGILIYDITDEKIWAPANDSTTLYQHYIHRNDRFAGKSFAAAKEDVKQDYMRIREDMWLKELRKKYPYMINTSNFEYYFGLKK